MFNTGTLKKCDESERIWFGFGLYCAYFQVSIKKPKTSRYFKEMNGFWEHPNPNHLVPTSKYSSLAMHA